MSGPAHLTLPSDGPRAAQYCLDAAGPLGSPEQIRAVAASLAATGGALREALAEFGAISTGDGTWVGAAADAFARATHALHGTRVAEVPVRYEAYAAALRRYAGELDSVLLDLASTRAKLHATLAARPRADHAMTQLAPHALPSPFDPRYQVWAEECARASGRFAHVYNDWVDTVHACARALHVVGDHDHLHNPHGFHGFVSAVANISADLSQATGTWGLLLTVVCPPLAEVFLGVSALASGVALLADLDRRIQYGEPVSFGDLAVDALGMVPPLRATRALASGLRSAPRAVAVGDSAARDVGESAARDIDEAVSTADAPVSTSVREWLGWSGESIRFAAPTWTTVSAAGRRYADDYIGEAISQSHDAFNARDGGVSAVLTSPIVVSIRPYRHLADMR